MRAHTERSKLGSASGLRFNNAHHFIRNFMVIHFAQSHSGFEHREATEVIGLKTCSIGQEQLHQSVQFRPLPAPSRSELQAVTEEVCAAVRRLRCLDPDDLHSDASRDRAAAQP